MRTLALIPLVALFGCAHQQKTEAKPQAAAAPVAPAPVAQTTPTTSSRRDVACPSGPLCSDHDEACWSQNRRADLMAQNGSSKPSKKSRRK